MDKCIEDGDKQCILTLLSEDKLYEAWQQVILEHKDPLWIFADLSLAKSGDCNNVKRLIKMLQTYSSLYA